LGTLSGWISLATACDKGDREAGEEIRGERNLRVPMLLGCRYLTYLLDVVSFFLGITLMLKYAFGVGCLNIVKRK
jgi:hypothetical protein